MTAALTTTRRRWLAATACAAWAVPAFSEGEQRRDWPRGRATPSVQLPMLDGGAWTLAGVRGRPVLLNFWATWCEPCRAEMPSLQQLATRHQAQGLQVLAINFREADSTVRRFMATTALGLPVLLDADGGAAKAFGVHTFPSTVGVDRAGKARYVVTGEVDWAGPQAERWIEALR